MIHFSRPSSSHDPPQRSQASIGTLKYRRGAIFDPQPEQNIREVPSRAMMDERS